MNGTRSSAPSLARLAILSLALLTGCAAPGPDTDAMAKPSSQRTVFVTRHAEKQRFSADPSLSERGVQRAEALALLPETQNVTTIITTQFRRTAETAQPLAERRSIESRVIPATARPEDLRALANEIRSRASEGDVLIVGHSNTVPMIIAALGGPDDIFLADETDFGDLFTLTLDDQGNFTAIERSRYGD